MSDWTRSPRTAGRAAFRVRIETGLVRRLGFHLARMVTFTPGMKAATSPAEAIREYLAEIQDNLKSGIAREQTHRSALERLLESLDPTASALNDPAHISVGAPDFTIRRKGRAMDFPIGWVETKDVDDDLDKVEKSEQLQRYLGSLQNLVLTDYLEFRWYRDGKKRLTARLVARGGQESDALAVVLEWLGAIAEVHGAVEGGMGLDEIGGHGDGVVEVGEGRAGEFLAAIESFHATDYARKLSWLERFLG